MPLGEHSATDSTPADELLTVREAADLLKCSISFVYKLLKQGQIGYERRGRRKLPLARSVSDYRQRSLVHHLPVEGHRQTTASPSGRYLHLFSKRQG